MPASACLRMHDLPFLHLETDHSSSNVEQLRTGIEAFLEMQGGVHRLDLRNSAEAQPPGFKASIETGRDEVGFAPACASVSINLRKKCASVDFT